MVKIATFNVNSVKTRMPILEAYLKGERAPDILCLQETKCQDKDFPEEFFEKLGYKSSFKGMKSYNGVAIVSKEEPDEVSFGIGDGEEAEREESENARVVRAVFKDLTVVNSYVPQGKSIDNPDYPYKLRFFKRLSAMFEREVKSGGKLLWLGDLNVAPTDIDVSNPKTKKNHVCFHTDVKRVFEEVKAESKLIDIFRKHRPDEGEFSFWDYRVKNALERNIGWRIDHILGTEDVASASSDAWVERGLRAMERPSDHTAVTASFDLD